MKRREGKRKKKKEREKEEIDMEKGGRGKILVNQNEWVGGKPR